MIFYLTSEKNQFKLDFLQEDFLFNKAIVSFFDEAKFLRYIKMDIRNISNMYYFIVDIDIFYTHEIYLEKCLESFWILNPYSTVILISDTFEDKGELLGESQLKKDLFYLIHADDMLEQEISRILYNQIEEGGEIEKELDEYTKELCISKASSTVNPDALFKKASTPIKVSERQENRKDSNESLILQEPNIIRVEEIFSLKNLPNKRWSCEDILIGVIGAERRVGPTTAAIRLANLLHLEGAKTSYVEANSHQHLDDIAKQYNFIEMDSYYIKKGVSYFSGAYDTTTNFNICDLGSISENEERLLKLNGIFHKIFLVSGNKHYELNDLNKALHGLKDTNNIGVIFNMSSKDEIEPLKQRYKEEVTFITGAIYSSNIFYTKWEDMLEFFINKYCIEKK